MHQISAYLGINRPHLIANYQLNNLLIKLHILFIFALNYALFIPVYTILFTIYAFLIFISFHAADIFPSWLLLLFSARSRAVILFISFAMLWADFFMFMMGIRHRNIYEAPHDRSKQYVFVFNHISYMDIPIMIKSIRRQQIQDFGQSRNGQNSSIWFYL